MSRKASYPASNFRSATVVEVMIFVSTLVPLICFFDFFSQNEINVGIRSLLLILFIGLYYVMVNDPEQRVQIMVRRSLIFGLSYALFSVLHICYLNVAEPHIWDFLAWYLHGSVAVNGLNFYDPAGLPLIIPELDLPVNPSPRFERSVLSVGFHYFPQSMLFIAPLGLFSYQNAQIAWMILNLFCLIGIIITSYRLFFSGFRNGWLFCTVIILLYPATKSNIYFEQTGFMLTLFLLLAFKKINHRYTAGFWLALSAIIKPIGLIFGLYLIVRKKWANIFGGIVVILILTLLTIFVFGWETFSSFFSHNPSLTVPEAQYLEILNQSLLSNILRLSDFDFSSSRSPLMYPPFVIGVVILTLLTIYVVIKSVKCKRPWGFVLVVALAVVIYPGSLRHYTISLIISFLMILSEGVNGTNKKSIIYFSFLSIFIISYPIAIIGNVGMWVFIAFLIMKESSSDRKIVFQNQPVVARTQVQNKALE